MTSTPAQVFVGPSFRRSAEATPVLEAATGEQLGGGASARTAASLSVKSSYRTGTA